MHRPVAPMRRLCTAPGRVASGAQPACPDASKSFASVLIGRWSTRRPWAVHGFTSWPVWRRPINTRDMPGYFLTHQDQAHAAVQAVGAANLRVQMDLYHCQIMEGDLATKLHQYLPTGRVGHIQIAGVPERHEPDTGELNYPYLFNLVDALGYRGWVGCEYRPSAGTQAGATRQGLQWIPRG